MIIYPIKQVLEGRIINFSSNNAKYVRCSLEIGVSYQDPPQKIKAVLKDILSGISEVMKKPEPEIRLKTYGDFSITYQALYAIEDFEKKWEVENAVNTAIWERFKQEGITIPFPIMDVTVHQP